MFTPFLITGFRFTYFLKKLSITNLIIRIIIILVHNENEILTFIFNSLFFEQVAVGSNLHQMVNSI